MKKLLLCFVCSLSMSCVVLSTNNEFPLKREPRCPDNLEELRDVLKELNATSARRADEVTSVLPTTTSASTSRRSSYDSLQEQERAEKQRLHDPRAADDIKARLVKAEETLRKVPVDVSNISGRLRYLIGRLGRHYFTPQFEEGFLSQVEAVSGELINYAHQLSTRSYGQLRQSVISVDDSINAVRGLNAAANELRDILNRYQFRHRPRPTFESIEQESRSSGRPLIIMRPAGDALMTGRPPVQASLPRSDGFDASSK